MYYQHDVEVLEQATEYADPLATRYAAQAVVGTAPVFLLDDPEAAVNQAIQVSSMGEAREKLGYMEDFHAFTLCASMKASFELFNVYPVFFINVLDPKKHSKENAEKEYAVKEHQIVLDEQYVLSDSLKVKKLGDTEGTELTPGVDYLAAYDENRRLMLTLLLSGSAAEEEKLLIASSSLDPEAVTEEDIIGAYDVVSGKRSGIEVIRTIHPRFGIAPGLVLAPGWSKRPNVAAALQNMYEELNGVYRCEGVLDLDTEKAKKYTDCKKVKDEGGYTGVHAAVVWPCVQKGGMVMPYSAVWAAQASYLTAVNGDVPYLYPSNKLLNVDGAVLEDGTEVSLDRTQAAYLNGDGIITALNDSGWKSCGNNMACYPEVTDPKDRWVSCRRMFSFAANYFINSNRSRLDDLMNKAKIDDVINRFNIFGNSLVSQGMMAGIRAEYLEEDNKPTELMEGRLRVRLYLAPYTPLEYILAVAEFDMNTLQMAILGEEA